MAIVDDFDQALEVDVLAAALALDRSETGDLLTLLAQKLTGILPKNTRVKRGLLGLGEIQTVTLSFAEDIYEIDRNRDSSLTAKSIKVVRGIKIKTTEMTTTEWSQAVARSLSQIAVRDAEVRAGLNRFILK